MYTLKDRLQETRYKKVLISNEQYNELRENLKSAYRYIAPIDAPREDLRAIPTTNEAIKLFRESPKTWFRYVRLKK